MVSGTVDPSSPSLGALYLADAVKRLREAKRQADGSAR